MYTIILFKLFQTLEEFLSSVEHKSITLNVIEFAKFWMDKSRIGQYAYIKMLYGLVSGNIKLQKTI